MAGYPGGGLNLGVPFGVFWSRTAVTPGPPGPQGPQGPPGDRGEPGPPGADAITDIHVAQMADDDDVQLSPQGFITSVLSLGLPPGRFVITATMALENMGLFAHDVAVWATSVPPPAYLEGARASQATLAPGAVASVTLGPFVVTIDRGGVIGWLNAQRDPANPSDQVWARAATRVAFRAGGTGIVALGHDVAL